MDSLTFTVHPGRVTGFLGPNGAGKSTTMRTILGLDQPTSGRTRVLDRPYRELTQPLQTVGALLDANALGTWRDARDQLMWLAQSNRIDVKRIDAALDRVGLSNAARRPVRNFSLGMRQRLGIATALLGDPPVLMFDEPVNGLDTEGIRWLRALLTELAEEGRTVLLSSHLMSEMELIADHLIVIGQGRLLADSALEALLDEHSARRVLVRSSNDARLATALREKGGRLLTNASGGWVVGGMSPETIGQTALVNDVAIVELTPQSSSLEDVYTKLTEESAEYRSKVVDK